MLTMQDALARLTAYWTDQGCLTVQPMNTEVGAGTLNPATFLRVLGPEPWRVVYVEPSVRPDDSRYGENPNRIQTHTQLQVVLKPEPGNAQEIYLASLAALGIDVAAHDVRFVEDNWASPAVGAWGLGWEVWLDGLEITQFTYLQQAGGINLSPPSVEITYGIERILMALQGVRHFKDIVYAKGVSYGEVFGQGEYEMSRYYLDDADIDTNRRLLDLYAAEAQRMVDAGLPVPAHSYVLKSSHAFNVLDSRGAVSTADRAAEFGRMRRLAGDVARLWVERRDELGHPLGEWVPPLKKTAGAAAEGDRPRMLVFEIGTEEMAPSAAVAAVPHLRERLAELLGATRLAHGEIRVHATPRRLIALVPDVAAREDDRTHVVKGPRLGAPQQALDGFARAQGAPPQEGETHYYVERFEAGRPAGDVLADVLAELVKGLRSPRNMRWNDPELSFTRPIRWLLALLGDDVVPVAVSTLAAGRETRVLRDADEPVVTIASAETFMEAIAVRGIVADAEDREELIVTGARDLVYPEGQIDFSGLVEELTYLVEAPNPLLGTFDESYLALPAEVLTTVMRKHQRYLPVRDETGALLPMFVTVANGVVDVEAVRAGNEAVLRARYEDASFFYRADREVPLPVLRERLGRLTFTDKLGSMADRAARISSLATGWSSDVVLKRAAELVKVDFGSQMVTEMTSLAGVMARDYLLHAGESRAVAQAVYECELPRAAGGELPESLPGAMLSLADRLDLLVGLAATVGLPTGSSDPFAVRRAALGILAVLRNLSTDLRLSQALEQAASLQPVPVGPEILAACADFLTRRLEQQLIEEGNPVDRVRAALVHAERPARVDHFLAQLSTLADDPSFRAVAAALGRARRIVPADVTADFDPALLTSPPEISLISVLSDMPPVDDLVSLTAASDPLVAAVQRFFDEVLVMADDPAIRSARLGLVATVRDLGVDLLDWLELRI